MAQWLGEDHRNFDDITQPYYVNTDISMHYLNMGIISLGWTAVRSLENNEI